MVRFQTIFECYETAYSCYFSACSISLVMVSLSHQKEGNHGYQERLSGLFGWGGRPHGEGALPVVGILGDGLLQGPPHLQEVGGRTLAGHVVLAREGVLSPFPHGSKTHVDGAKTH